MSGRGPEDRFRRTDRRSGSKPQLVSLPDAYQRRARERAGIEQIRTPQPKPDLVAGIVPMQCDRCGCTGARVSTAKSFACEFCGHVAGGAHRRPLTD